MVAACILRGCRVREREVKNEREWESTQLALGSIDTKYIQVPK